MKKVPQFIEVAERIMALAKDAVIVCHNVAFYLGFLSSELGRINKHLPTVLTLDTLEIAREYFGFDLASLQSITDWLDIEVIEAHRALYRCRRHHQSKDHRTSYVQIAC